MRGARTTCCPCCGTRRDACRPGKVPRNPAARDHWQACSFLAHPGHAHTSASRTTAPIRPRAMPCDTAPDVRRMPHHTHVRPAHRSRGIPTALGNSRAVTGVGPRPEPVRTRDGTKNTRTHRSGPEVRIPGPQGDAPVAPCGHSPRAKSSRRTSRWCPGLPRRACSLRPPVGMPPDLHVAIGDPRPVAVGFRLEPLVGHRQAAVAARHRIRLSGRQSEVHRRFHRGDAAGPGRLQA